ERPQSSQKTDLEKMFEFITTWRFQTGALFIPAQLAYNPRPSPFEEPTTYPTCSGTPRVPVRYIPTCTRHRARNSVRDTACPPHITELLIRLGVMQEGVTT
ncbi:hypothetical protein PIB30_076411, partial [Stylosanthes scabra]|nr:hypothetical protein [Stylosanthes scabra]